MQLGTFDLVSLVAILLLNLVVGLALSRRAGRGQEEYYLAGRSLPWWLLGTSMVATTFALDTPLTITEFIVSAGLYQNWIWISLALSHLFVAFFLASCWRRSGALTDVELCELRYEGEGAAALRAIKGTVFALGLNCISLATVFFAVEQICKGFGYADETIAGLPLAEVILVGGLLLTVIYSASAGLWGVVTTDAFQFILALGGAVLVAWLALGHPQVGGLDGLRRGLEEVTATRAVDRELEAALAPLQAAAAMSNQAGATPRGDPLSLVPRGFGEAEGARVSVGGAGVDDAGLTLLVFFFVMWWAWKFSDGGGVLIQRMLAAKDERHALLGTLWFCVGHYVIRWWPWALAALASVIVFRDSGAPASAAYPKLVAEVVPLGLRGFVLAYFIAAFMSTVDTHIQLASSYLVNDVYKRFLRPEAPQRHYVRVGRLTTVAVLILAYLTSQVYSSFKEAYLFILNLVAGAGVVFLLRWFWWRINAWSEITALAASLIIAGSLFLYNLYAAPPDRVPIWAITLINVFGSGALWLTVTFLTAPTSAKRLADFYGRSRPWGFWGPVRGGEETRPWGRAMACWLLSSASIFASLFGIRALVLGDVALGLAILSLAAAAAAWVWKQIPSLLEVEA